MPSETDFKRHRGLRCLLSDDADAAPAGVVLSLDINNGISMTTGVIHSFCLFSHDWTAAQQLLPSEALVFTKPSSVTALHSTPPIQEWRFMAGVRHSLSSVNPMPPDSGMMLRD